MYQKSSKVYIETLGCQMNKSDTERILGILSNFNYTEVKTPQEADFLIVNTCSIRALSEEKAFSRLGLWGKWKRLNKPHLKIALCGCTAQLNAQDYLNRFPFLDLVFGTQNIYELPSLIEKIEKGERICAVRDYVVNEIEPKFIRVKNPNAWLPIIEGCNNFCTYCVVPYTRGRERSRDFNLIVEEAKQILKEGFSEITLLGQNVDSYGKDLENKPTLANLLREINKLDGKFRIRFTTSYPTDITDDLIQAVKECDKVCKYFHIPMQSGDNRILKMMNRRYTREQYSNVVKRIRDEIPQAIITSDFIVGFPSETNEEFKQTLSAIDEFNINYSNIASYSPRPKTPAGKMVDKFIDEEEKDRRFQILNDKIKETSHKNHEKCLGKTMEILVDGIGKGRTTCNKIVHFNREAKIGDFIEVKITQTDTWHLKGE